MGKQYKTILMIAIPAGLAVIAAACFGLFWLGYTDAFGTHKSKMLEYYQDDSNYYSASATIMEVASLDSNGCQLRLYGTTYERNVYGWDPCYYAIHYSNADELWNRGHRKRTWKSHLFRPTRSSTTVTPSQSWR